MANPKYVELLKQGVAVWNRWRAKNPEVQIVLFDSNWLEINPNIVGLLDTDLYRVDLSDADLYGVDLHGADLSRVDLSDANLRGANLRGANLLETNLSDANLSEVDLSWADLRGADLRWTDLVNANLFRADLYLANLRGAELHVANLQGANLHGAKLCRATLFRADLSGADLYRADLSEANLHGANLRLASSSRANLSGANLRRAQVSGTNFERSVFTGACLDAWNIGSTTNFEGAICEYVYLKAKQKERRPREGYFKPGEFVALFQKSVGTIDFIFNKADLNWPVFNQAVKDLRRQYPNQDLAIQSVITKCGGVFIIRVEVAEGADKSAIESRVKELYETMLALREP
ncbi:pentapeptide repeat-containing protein [Adonisia turfae]